MDVVLLTSGPDDGNQITPYRTIGAYKIAHSVRSAGYSCQVIDHLMFLTEEQLRTLVFKFVTAETAVVGISTTFLAVPVIPSHFKDSLINVLNDLTDQFPNLKLVFGGYATHLVNKGPHQPKIKKPYAFINQYGEDTFVDVVRNIKGHGDEPAWTVTLMPGTLAKIKEYSAPLTVRYNIETDNFKFVEQDCILPNETLPIEISRGCIFKCKFCNHLLLGRGKLDYLRDFELVKQELLDNYARWGTTNYYVICDTFNDTEYKMKAWHQMVTSLPFKINWTSYLRADLLDRFPDVPYMLAETGLTSCYHGIETFGPQASQTIGKGWSGKSAREYLPRLYHDIWNKQVFQTLSFIVGLPGDTRESIQDTAHWFNDADMYNISWHPLGLSKSGIKHASEFERNAEQYGYTFLTHNTWKNNYWDTKSASSFAQDVLKPLTDATNARHGSWKILQLMQLGYQHKDFLKENDNLWTRADQDSRGQTFINQYVSRLLDL
jgi:hypothetical protein